jgi:hypothetical protein
MPNGHSHDDNQDVISYAFTSQGYPTFHVARYYKGIRMFHLLGHRGYAPIVDVSLLREPDFYKGPASMADRLDAYTEAFKALLTSNPNDALNLEIRRARMALLSFSTHQALCVGYALYQRKRGEPWREHLPVGWPFAGLDTIEDELRQQLFEQFRPSPATFYYNGLPLYGAHGEPPAQLCTVDFKAADEVLCASTSLSGTSEWAQMDDVEHIFTAEASGLLLSAMRERALADEQDVQVFRWQRPAA